MHLLKNIKSYFPKDSIETKNSIYKAYKIKGPCFISLKNDKKINKNFNFLYDFFK